MNRIITRTVKLTENEWDYLLSALRSEINRQEGYETKELKYTSDSIYLANLRGILKMLERTK